MNLGKPRRRLEVAQRPSIDIDAHLASDAPTDSPDAQDRESEPSAIAPHAGREAAAELDDRTDR